jgi:STE24 endopeptidase
MNSLFWMIVLALTADFMIRSVAIILNVRFLSPSPPTGLDDIYEADGYRRSQEYIRAQSQFGLTVRFLKLGGLLIVWFAGGFNYIDQAVRLIGWNEISNGVLFFGILGVLTATFNILAECYATFVIEERFGFNKTNYKTFIFDALKGTVLSAVIGLPLLGGVLFFFEYTGTLSWLYAWVFAVVITLVISVIGPIWIMPMFNKFSRLESGELRDAIVDYASSVNFTYGNTYIIDGSKRSAHSNAFFAGFGKTKRIALFDTLIDQLSIDEIVSVIAHEVGHNKKNHIAFGLCLGVVHVGVLLFLFSRVMEQQVLFDAFLMDEVSIYASLMFFGFMLTPIELLISPAMQYLSRRNEYQADQWAVATTTDRRNLESGLKKLAAKNLANLSPHPFFVALNYSHPPLSSRLRSIQSGVSATGDS